MKIPVAGGGEGVAPAGDDASRAVRAGTPRPPVTMRPFAPRRADIRRCARRSDPRSSLRLRSRRLAAPGRWMAGGVCRRPRLAAPGRWMAGARRRRPKTATGPSGGAPPRHVPSLPDSPAAARNHRHHGRVRDSASDMRVDRIEPRTRRPVIGRMIGRHWSRLPGSMSSCRIAGRSTCLKARSAATLALCAGRRVPSVEKAVAGSARSAGSAFAGLVATTMPASPAPARRLAVPGGQPRSSRRFSVVRSA
jgi:hypothetical protein